MSRVGLGSVGEVDGSVAPWVPTKRHDIGISQLGKIALTVRQHKVFKRTGRAVGIRAGFGLAPLISIRVYASPGQPRGDQHHVQLAG